MRFCISSIFLLTQCSPGFLDWFTLASASSTPSSRSTPDPLEPKNYTTPHPYIYRRTLFEILDFWSGESLKSRRNNDCAKNKIKPKTTTTHDESLGKRRSGSRRNYVDSSRSQEYGERSRNSSHTPDVHSNESLLTDTKLHGYSLKQDMERLMMNLRANVSVSTLATTVEVHDIVLVKISQRKGGKYFRAMEGQPKYVDEKPQKKIILIVHGLSAMGLRNIPCLYNRESFMKLVRMYTRHLDKFDIFLMPMANPDGIADETLQVWNKNKSPQLACYGVSLDRNFDVKFPKNHSISPCSQHYPGPQAFSEPESRAVADLIHHYNHKIVAYIHVLAGAYDAQTYKGDAVLHPKGYDESALWDDKYLDIDAGIEEAMRNAGFKNYGVTSTSMAKWYGLVAGTSVDYATSIYGIPYGLEFVMQPYIANFDVRTSDEIRDNVLTEVWSKVIDVVFNTIYKSIQQADESDSE